MTRRISGGRLALWAGLLSASWTAAWSGSEGGGLRAQLVVATANTFVLRQAVSATWATSRVKIATGRTRFDLPTSLNPVANGWYRVEARVQVLLDEESARGTRGEIDIGANGVAGIEVGLEGYSLDSLRGAWWGSDNLMRGFVYGSIWARVGVIDITDYLPFHTIHRGRNDLYIRAFNFGGGLVESATLLPGTRVLYSRLAPAQVRLSVHSESAKVVVGQKFGIRFTLTDQGLPALNVGLMVSVSRGGVAIVGSPTIFLGVIAGRRDGEIDCVGLVPGVYRLTIWAQGNSGTGPLGGVAGGASVRVVGTGRLA